MAKSIMHHMILSIYNAICKPAQNEHSVSAFKKYTPFWYLQITKPYRNLSITEPIVQEIYWQRPGNSSVISVGLYFQLIACER